MEMSGSRASSRSVVAIATVLALATVAVSAAAGGQVHAAVAQASPSTTSRLINVTHICLSTPYPRACKTALRPAATTAGDDPFAASVRFAMSQASSALALARNFSSSSSTSHLRGGGTHRPKNKLPPSGMDDCAELLDITHDHLARVLLTGAGDDDDGVATWLSAAMTNQRTCADSLATSAKVDAAARDAVRARVKALEKFVGTALALHVSKANNKAAAAGGTAATATSSSSAEEDELLPAWVSEHDKKLLRAASPSAVGVTPHAVVALDGTGTHRSIGEAIADVTATEEGGGGGSGGRKVIYVKAGRYQESVSIGSKQRNVMLMGDGVGSTVIVDGKSVAGGYTTYNSATVAAMGSGFIAKGLTIVNSAGPGKGQAVALRVGGDLSVVHGCAIQAYQDTLYVYANRQFYTGCTVAGTVDFIFGNAAAVLQGCEIQARRPSPGQEDTVTAQGRTDPNQNTGIAIHRCRVTAAGDLGGAPVYLGRPWQRYSRTVVMKTFLDGSVAPAGWLQWSGQFALSTLYYGEYGNTGPGAGTAKRVTWSGVHSALSTSDATKFTVGEFIMGDSWLPGTGVSYVSGL